jgi:putative ABC transport system permease protein
MALGARPADILWMVLRHGSIVVASGLVFGLLCAFGAGRLIQPFLVINPADPLTYATVSGLLAIVALTAVLHSRAPEHHRRSDNSVA